VRLRSLLLVPANREGLAEEASGLDADAFVLDLADSVPLAEKEAARTAARDGIARLAAAGKSVWVRINSTFSLLARDDVRAVVCAGLTGLLVPKCERPEQVLYLEALLRDAEPAAGVKPGTVRLIPAIESAAALLRAAEIARASERAAALFFGGENFVADFGLTRAYESGELAYARSAVAVAARAARLQAIDTAYPNLHDDEGLRRDARTALALGMTGKLAQHPEQLGSINDVFAPDPAAVERARALVAAHEAATKEGRGAIEVEGVLVDAPVVARARALLSRAGVPERDEAADAAPPAASPEQAPRPGRRTRARGSAG
jgi:citrate lyase subunit beta/citryl-CoA lyase